MRTTRRARTTDPAMAGRRPEPTPAQRALALLVRREHSRPELALHQLREATLGIGKVLFDLLAQLSESRRLGGVFDALKPVRATLEIEINAATDNPLLFPDHDDEAVLSGGNFHGHPLALACDAAKTAVASLGEAVP